MIITEQERVLRRSKFFAFIFLLVLISFFQLYAQTFSETYFTLLPAGTDGTAGTNAQYALFGDWPQSRQPYDVSVDETKSVQVGAFTYYYGSDDYWYAKADYDYYKVEPIKWRIVTDNYNGNTLLLSENTLMFLEWYDESSASSRVIDGKEIYDNNYEHSRIRAYLNGLAYTVKKADNSVQLVNKEFLDKGFLQTAFTEYERNYIADTKVENSPENSATETGFYNYNTASLSASRDTVDKIFLLSRKEATTKNYGFSEYYETGYQSARLRYPVPFASALQESDNEYKWWLRSPYAAFYSEPLYVDKNSNNSSLLSSLGVVVGEERNLFIENAMTYLGVPYVYGGLSRTGIDCSGLTYLAAQSIRLQIPRTAAMQYDASKRIKDNERLPGDLVFFSENGKKVSHVGIYVGDGKMLNAVSSGSTTGVIISTLSSPYWVRTYFGAGRIIEDSSASLSVTQQGSNLSEEERDSPLFNHATHYVFTVESSGSMRISEDGGAESSAGGGYYGVVPALCISSNIPVLEKIEIASKPSKTTYNAGEELDLTGLSIAATYSDGKKKEISRYSVSGFDSEIAGTHQLTIHCAEMLVEKELKLDYTIAFPFNGTFTGEFKPTEYKELPKGTDGTAGKKGRYALFGDWPQTRKASNVAIDETKKVTSGGNTYYLGSDGAFYAKTEGTEYKKSAYFKVEPIKWRIVSDDYDGAALLIAENILTTSPWYKGYDYSYSSEGTNSHRYINATTIYPNNYEYSTVRAFLNGLSYYTLEETGSHTQIQSSEFLNKGFLQSAFSKLSQGRIVNTIIDNSSESTAKDERWSKQTSRYLSNDTQDKIFLLSVNEITRIEYGFGDKSNNAKVESRRRSTTDFAKEKGSRNVWWLRSPSDSFWQSAYRISDCSVEYENHDIDSYHGVVPALCLPSYMVTPAEKAILESIKINSSNYGGSEYEQGESVAWIIMDIDSLIANYSDGTSKEIMEYTIKGFNSTKPGKHTVTISYTENGITKETPFIYIIKSSGQSGTSAGSAETDDYKIVITDNGRTRSMSTTKLPRQTNSTSSSSTSSTGTSSTSSGSTGSTGSTNKPTSTGNTSSSSSSSGTSAVSGAITGAVVGAASATGSAVAEATTEAVTGVISSASVSSGAGTTGATGASSATGAGSTSSTSSTSTASGTGVTSSTGTSTSAGATTTSSSAQTPTVSSATTTTTTSVASTTQTATSQKQQATVSNTLRTGYIELPAGTDGSVGKTGKYVLFGEWPQSIKEKNVTINEAKIKKSGSFIYYYGSDGCWYAEAYAMYFKVEPIKWRVLTEDYNGYTLLLAENSLIDCQFYDYIYNRNINGKVVYPNNYEHSRIRAFLNGLSYQTKELDNSKQSTNKEFLNKGFLQTAFSNAAQKVIVPTTVNNSVEGSARKFASANTTDKIFLLSRDEVSLYEYGFTGYTQSATSRIRNATDFLELTGENPYSDWITGRYWWLRTPYHDTYTDDGCCVRQVLYDGNVEEYDYINDYVDVVPALCIAK